MRISVAIIKSHFVHFCPQGSPISFCIHIGVYELGVHGSQLGQLLGSRVHFVASETKSGGSLPLET